MSEEYNNFLIESFEYDAEQTSLVTPLVIDAGSKFKDDEGRIHSDACGWLAIHAALHYAYFMGRMPEPVKSRFLNHEFTPGVLKMINNASLNERISREQISCLATYIDVLIYLRECDGEIILGPMLNGCTFNINLWMSGGHYYVRVDREEEESAVMFASKFASYGYADVKYLDPLGMLEADRRLAEQLQKEWA